MVSRDGELVGSFSGCEMSKVSGTVSGIFRASKATAGEHSDEDSEHGDEDSSAAAAAAAPDAPPADE